MPVEPEAGEPTAPKKARTWLWWIAAWFLWTFVADEVLEAALDWMVAVGGYGFSNAVLGLLTLGVCFIAVQRTHVKHARREAEGDPDPLPAAYDYVTQAQAGLCLGWGAAVLGWALPLLLLILLGPASALSPWPVLGTTALIHGRMEMEHARVMDARRGRPPARGATR
ncbi:hypothetical protein RCG67_10980 [Kocuria sp. CPCC 205292]|uniref:hypothetical protein n=1 Tax=Kocuria cellulosilytica TaxID=3071451 RepID=UPI0034D67E4A